jgi:hypothetical protein
MILEHTKPFRFLHITDHEILLPENERKILYDAAMKYVDDKGGYESGELWAQQEKDDSRRFPSFVWNGKLFLEGVDDILLGLKGRMEKILLDVFSDLDPTRFYLATTPTVHVTNPNVNLEPHIDSLGNRQIIKYVIYLGDPELSYDECGTRIYENEEDSSFVKELPFVPGDAFVFVDEGESWHGTDWKDMFINRRFTIIGEYVTRQSAS